MPTWHHVLAEGGRHHIIYAEPLTLSLQRDHNPAGSFITQYARHRGNAAVRIRFIAT